MSGRYAFATLVTSDHYLPGALAVAAALKEVHPSPPVFPEVSFQTVCIVTPETVDVKTVKHLRRAYDVVIGVEVIEEETAAGLQLLGRPDLHTVLTKLHVFRLTQFEKIIFLDADILPLRPLSHLLTLPDEFSAVPDVGWPDIFNSGMMVLTPGLDKFNAIMDLVKSKGSWDGGDQGVLNEWRGSNWNRLSFTYNTTPTAVYTYAPAYERFGSNISALHFIGPSKPWFEIPYRAPASAVFQPPVEETPSAPAASLSSTVTAPAAPAQSYAYSTLVDRWFDVYDRNYRQAIPPIEQIHETKRYENVWNEPAPTREPPQYSQIVNSPSGGALGLDGLRRMALEGSSSTTRQDGEGEYRSLPLEGRIDLMRPKKEPPPSEAEVKVEVEPSTPADRRVEEGHPGQQASSSDGGQQSWQWQEQSQPYRLPTPGPGEVPPSPHFTTVSLPPSGPPTPGPSVITQQTGGQDSHYEQHYQPSPSQPPSGSGSSPPPSGSGSSAPPPSGSGSPPPLPSDSGTAPPPPPSDHHQYHHEQQQHYQHQQQHQHSQPTPAPPGEPPRPRSPPLMNWNPAVEPPPNVPPTPSAFPSEAYFPNAWDMPPSSGRLHAALTGSPTQDSSSFFHAPPPSEIPRNLIHEGHYTNVMGHHQPTSQESRPQPDIRKVHTVFPWEEKPRHMPGRVFPAGDSAPPGAKYIEDMPPEPEPEPEAPAEEPKPVEKPESPRMHVQLPSPPIGFPGGRSYSNAWDSVPSIQKYAARLVKPPPVPSPPPLPASPRSSRRRSDSYRSRGEQSDANSMDGDVEDEVDDDEEANGGGRFSSSERSDGGKSKRKLEKSGSKSPPTGGTRSKSGKKDYRSYGVQTIPKDVRSVAVQVSQTSSFPTGRGDDLHKKPPGRPHSRQGSGTFSPAMPPAPAAGHHIDFPRQPLPQELRLGMEPMASASPSVTDVQSFIRPPGRHSQQNVPTGMVSPRLHDTYSFDSPSRTPPGASSPVIPSRIGLQQQPTKPAVPSPQQTQPPLIVSRASSTSTESTVGPVSPVDSTIGLPTRKPIGRIWNPATGVDVFKRGSEEVLARFLRMGSWEDGPSTPTHNNRIHPLP